MAHRPTTITSIICFFLELTATPEEWKGWLVSQHKLPDQPIADDVSDLSDDDAKAVGDNNDDGYNDDGYNDNYISRGLCGTGPVNQKDFTIQEVPNIPTCPVD